MGRKERPQRPVNEERRHLACAACGAGHAADEAARALGWFRCSHCGAASLIPGAGDFLLESPGQLATRLVRPGSSEIQTDKWLVFTVPRWLLGIAVADVLLTGALWLVHRAAPEWHAVALLVGVGLLVTIGGAAFLLTFTRQHLEIRQDRLAVTWRTLGRTWRRRALTTTRFRTRRQETGRQGLELRCPGARAFVFMDDLKALRWLEREVKAAIEDARLDGEDARIPCPGCGGPIALKSELQDAGATDCPHCDVGLVQTRGGISMPAARIGHRLEKAEKPTLVRPVRRGGGVEWTLPAWSRRHPIAAPINVLIVLLLEVGVAAFFAFLAWKVPVLRSLVAIFGLLILAAALATWPAFLRWMYGRVTFRVDGEVFEHHVRIGRWTARRLRVPLVRLLEIDAHRTVHDLDGTKVPSDEIPITVRTATATHVLEVYGRGKEDAVAEVIASLPERLRALGRDVVLTGKGVRNRFGETVPDTLSS